MITSRCTECQQTMLDGVLKHLESCTAKSFERGYYIDTARPPAIRIEFDSATEQKEWMDNLKKGQSS